MASISTPARTWGAIELRLAVIILGGMGFDPRAILGGLAFGLSAEPSAA
jgi:branched-subunit amino acid ABC-type transport system permease component